MSFATSAGTTIAISASAPANYNKAGYEALVFTPIGEVTDLGDIPDRIYDLVTHQPLATRGVQKGKGGYNLGSQTIVYAIDPADQGQIAVDAAVNSDSAYSVKIAHPSLGTIYARALIMGGPKNYGTVSSVASKSVTLEYSAPSASVDGIVIVPPA